MFRGHPKNGCILGFQMVDRKILNNFPYRVTTSEGCFYQCLHNFSDKLLFSAVIGAIVPVEKFNTTRNNI